MSLLKLCARLSPLASYDTYLKCFTLTSRWFIAAKIEQYWAVFADLAGVIMMHCFAPSSTQRNADCR